MSKIKILEVNNIDLPGNRFNGYDMIEEITDEKFDITQAVINKVSDNKKVIEIYKSKRFDIIHEMFEIAEREQSIHNVFSISTPALLRLKEYKEADIVHFHMFHNSKFSLYSLIKIANEKKVVISIHDPWFLTGRCVHFYECEKWKTGCKNCPNLRNLFELKEDNCNQLWNLKKHVFDNIDIDLVCSSDWMLEKSKQTPIFKNQKNYHKIPLGIDYKKFSSITRKEAREKLEIADDEIVLFFRAQNEFKGTPYIVEAMKLLDTTKKVTIMTCDNKELVNDLKENYRVIELGRIKDKEMICAMNACDIFLMPSIGESFGMMAVEAMACEKPVIVFNNSALPSVTHAPECGYLVKDRDSEDLMKAIKHLVEDEKERIKRGKLSKKIVEEEYSIDDYNQKLKDMYLSVMNRKHKKYSENQPKKDYENENNFKSYLNQMTERIFGNNKEVKKELLYEVDKTKLNKNKIKYDDFNIQRILEDYLIKVEKIAFENNNYIKKNTKLRRIMYYLKYDRDILIEKILRRLGKKN